MSLQELHFLSKHVYTECLGDTTELWSKSGCGWKRPLEATLSRAPVTYRWLPMVTSRWFFIPSGKKLHNFTKQPVPHPSCHPVTFGPHSEKLNLSAECCGRTINAVASAEGRLYWAECGSFQVVGSTSGGHWWCILRAEMMKNCSCGMAEFYCGNKLAEAFRMNSIHNSIHR